jgi:uncharacterized protein YprB with RNaseH-like and TPR domain
MTAGLRAIARRRAERVPGEGAAWPTAAMLHAADAADRAVHGGALERIGGRHVCTVRRRVAELLPDARLDERMRAALGRLARRDPDDVDRGLRDAVGCRLGDLAVMDLETLGFWGCPVFLVGLLILEGGRLVTCQLLARDYPEEAGILAAAAEMLAGRRLLVTFNGKSYDVPCFRERAVYHGVAERLPDLRHVDVLHPARRRFRERLPDCRLVTLERAVCGIHRTGDVPSRDVPEAYHRYAATGDARWVEPVLHHSRVDLLTTARLLAELAG